MELTHLPLSLWATALGWIVGLPTLALALLVAPWGRLRRDVIAHAWCAGVLAMVLLWSASRALPGAHVYLLGTAAYALVAGPALALAGAALALLVTVALHGGLWLDAGLAYVLLAVVPVGVTAAVRSAAMRLDAGHRVLQSYLEGTIAGALAAITSTLTGALLLHGSGPARVLPEWDIVCATAVCLGCLEALVTSTVAIVWALHGPAPERGAVQGARALRAAASRRRFPVKR